MFIVLRLRNTENRKTQCVMQTLKIWFFNIANIDNLIFSPKLIFIVFYHKRYIFLFLFNISCFISCWLSIGLYKSMLKKEVLQYIDIFFLVNARNIDYALKLGTRNFPGFFPSDIFSKNKYLQSSFICLESASVVSFTCASHMAKRGSDSLRAKLFNECERSGSLRHIRQE